MLIENCLFSDERRMTRRKREIPVEGNASQCWTTELFMY